MTRVLIDANVLFPTVLREIVIGLARTGAFTPLWSPRILEEWRRVAERIGPADAQVAESEIARLNTAFPTASVTVSETIQARLHLPDENDIHVLAAAIDGDADELLTMNLKDFPTNALSANGIIRRDPDGFLLEAFHADNEAVRKIVDDTLARAEGFGIDVTNPRRILGRARVPRLGKALYKV